MIDKPEKAIALGLFVSDGWITTRKLCIELKDRDKHVLDWLVKELGFKGKLKRRDVAPGTHKIKDKVVTITI